MPEWALLLAFKCHDEIKAVGTPVILREPFLGLFGRHFKQVTHEPAVEPLRACEGHDVADNSLAVGREFFKWLFGCGESRINVKCIELPDGSVVGYKDAIEYLNKEEE